MSSVPVGSRLLLISIVAVAGIAFAAAPDDPAPSAGPGANSAAQPAAPQETAPSGQAAPAPPPARRGVVQEALRQVGTIPRPQGSSGTMAGKASGSASAVQPSARYPQTAPYLGPGHPRTIPMWSKNLAAPSRRAAPPAQPASSGVPDESDLESAGIGSPGSANGEQNEPASIGGYRGYGQYGYGRQGYYDYRRSLRWPAYSREWNDPVYGSGSETYYTYGDGGPGFGFGPGYAPGPGGPGYVPSYFEDTANARTESLLKSSMTSMDRGMKAFQEGRYREAADAFRLAADANQGDPAARIYAGHALFATGRYHDAVRYLRKAFELQSRIMYLTYDMRQDYRNRADFDQQLAALEEALRLSPADEDRLFTLGYVLYYGGQRENAYFAFQKLIRLNPRDKLVGQLMENCRPADVVLEHQRPVGGGGKAGR